MTEILLVNNDYQNIIKCGILAGTTYCMIRLINKYWHKILEISEHNHTLKI